MVPATILTIKNLTKTYYRNQQPVIAVDNLNLTVQKGDFVHIIGRSGSGKTTLLSLIAGLLKADAGAIILGENDFTNLDDETLAQIRNCKIGVITQVGSLISSLTVKENIILPWYLEPRHGDPHGRADYLLDMLNIRHLADAYPATLSGGEIRRALIARAMINDPEIILADEPTADLDNENTKEVMAMFTKLNQQGATLIVVTHELDTLTYGKTIYTMDQGRCVKTD